MENIMFLIWILVFALGISLGLILAWLDITGKLEKFHTKLFREIKDETERAGHDPEGSV